MSRLRICGLCHGLRAGWRARAGDLQVERAPGPWAGFRVHSLDPVSLTRFGKDGTDRGGPDGEEPCSWSRLRSAPATRSGGMLMSGMIAPARRPGRRRERSVRLRVECSIDKQMKFRPKLILISLPLPQGSHCAFGRACRAARARKSQPTRSRPAARCWIGQGRAGVTQRRHAALRGQGGAIVA